MKWHSSTVPSPVLCRPGLGASATQPLQTSYQSWGGEGRGGEERGGEGRGGEGRGGGEGEGRVEPYNVYEQEKYIVHAVQTFNCITDVLTCTQQRLTIDRITRTGLTTVNLTLLIRVTVVYNDVIQYPRARAWRRRSIW